MKCSIIASLLFAIGISLLYGGIFFWKKNDRRLSALQWFTILAIILGCFHTLLASIFELVNIPINIVSLAIGDILASIYFWYNILKNREYQKYEWKMIDTVFIFFILAGMAYLIKAHYGGTALRINYASIDAGVHFKTALYTVNSQHVYGMFYDMVWNASFIEFFGAFSSPAQFYHWYVLADVVNLALAAAMLYSIFRHRMKDLFTSVMGIILTVIYVITYPLNVTLFGFTYLGMSITIIGILIILVEFYLKDMLPKWFAIMALMLGCLGVFETYVLFAPVVYFSVIFCIFRKQFKNKKLVSKDTILICLSVFLIPCILGFWFVYGSIFTGGVTVSNAINNEGGCYRELFSNFIFFIPVALLGYIMLLKKKESSLLVFLTPLLVIFIFMIFIMVLKGKASTYYYYKLYYPIWLVVIVLNYYGILWVSKETKILSSFIWGIWIVLFVVFSNNIETRIQTKNPNILSEVQSIHYMDIINFNKTYFYLPTYDEKRLDLYDWSYKNVISQGKLEVVGAIRYEDNFWFQNITGQDFGDWDFYTMNYKKFESKLKESSAKYMLVFYDSPVYIEGQDYFNSLTKVYNNDIGFIAEIR